MGYTEPEAPVQEVCCIVLEVGKVICASVLCHLILLHLQVRTLLCLQNKSFWYPFNQCDFHSNTYPVPHRCTGTFLTHCSRKQSWPKLYIIRYSPRGLKEITEILSHGSLCSNHDSK